MLRPRGREQPGTFQPWPRTLSPYSYKFAPGLAALDAPTVKEPTFDTGKMAATGVLATTTQDREGDILEVAGIRTENHRLNPIALLDHGVYYPLPIGKTVDPEGNYTVVIDPDLGECLQTTYFSQSDPVAEQVYHLYAEGILRANSIGYRQLKAQRLPPTDLTGARPGRHILECELIEVTWCGIPCNPDAVRATLSRDRICGKSITPAVRSLLLPYAAPKKIWSPGASLPPTPTAIQSGAGSRDTGQGKAMSHHSDNGRRAKSQSYLDETQGGALARDGDTADQPASQDMTVSDEPYGAEYLRDLHAGLTDLVNHHTYGLKRLDNGKAKDAVATCLQNLADELAEIAAVFAAEYPDLPPLADTDPPEETDAGDEMTEDGKGGTKAVTSRRNTSASSTQPRTPASTKTPPKPSTSASPSPSSRASRTPPTSSTTTRTSRT